MNEKDWHMIIELDRCRNCTQAAKALYLSQPALTQALQRLESELGSTLFYRHAWGLEITETGRKCVLASRKMLKLYRDLENEFDSEGALLTGKITLGITNYLGSMILPWLLPRFQTKYPKIEIELIEATSDEMEEMIRSLEVDLGILHQPVNPSDFMMIPLCSHRFVAACSLNHPLASSQKTTLNPQLLKNEEFIMLYPGQRIRQISDKICAQAGFSPQIRYCTRSFETARNLAASGMGVTFLPENYNQFFPPLLPCKTFQLPDTMDASWTLTVSFAKEVQLSKPCQALIEVIKETITYLEKGKYTHEYQ